MVQERDKVKRKIKKIKIPRHTVLLTYSLVLYSLLFNFSSIASPTLL